MEYIVAFIIAGIAFAGYMISTKWFANNEQKDLTRQRLFEDDSSQQYSSNNTTVSMEASALFGTNTQKTGVAVTAEDALRKLGVDIKQAENKLGRRLLHAGIGSPNAVVLYLAFQRFVGPILILLGIIMAINTPEDAGATDKLLHGLLAVILMVVGGFGPKLYVENLTQKRKKKLLNGFPDTLDLLLVCVESGLALDAALNRVTGELGRVHPDITAELNRTRIELSLLNNRSQALQNFAERTDLIPFRFLVAALIQSERFGTSLTETLRVMADEYRTKRMLIAEEKAARLPALMTVPLIFCLMPSFMLIVLGPAIVSFMKSSIF